MLVLVTGGAGFIGSHTVDRLLAEGFNVRVLDNFSTGKRENLPSSDQVEIIEGDITDACVVDQAMQGVSGVIHLAALVSVIESINHPIVSCRDNALGFVQIVEAARKYQVSRIVYASSAAVYGLSERLPIAETDKTEPISFYGLDKLYDDMSAKLYHNLFGLSMLGMRYFNVYGSRQDPKSPYAGVISKFLDTILADRCLTVFGDGLQTRDYVHVSDVAWANVEALKKPQVTGVCNVATGKSISLNELIGTMESRLGRKLATDYLPAREGEAKFAEAVTERLNHELGIVARMSLIDGLSQLMIEAGCIKNGSTPQ